MIFSKKLISWYLQNKRFMPWRETKDPYHIWLSEIILQQTRVAQGLPYYMAFIDHYPTVFDLAKANEEHVLKLWQGLGYYSRARNLHTTAKYVANMLDGIFPTTYKELLGLKGVGDYTASAIASICHNEPVAVVDGNVYRVLARYFEIDTPINTTKGIREFKKLANTLIDHDNPADYNQAIMEFGALQCKPKNPNCKDCVLADGCLALENNMIATLPKKNKTLKVKKRVFNYLVFSVDNKTTIIQQRTGNGIWKGLYEFPLIEKTITKLEDITSHEVFKTIVGNQRYEITPYQDTPIVHKLSHQHLYTHFYIIKMDTLQNLNKKNQIEIDYKNIFAYPVPVLVSKFIEVFFADEELLKIE